MLSGVFRFRIGSWVRMMLSANQSNRRSWDSEAHNERRGQILARFLEECPGGEQKAYSVRWVSAMGDIHGELIRHNEIELVESEPFPDNEQKKKTQSNVFKGVPDGPNITSTEE